MGVGVGRIIRLDDEFVIDRGRILPFQCFFFFVFDVFE